MSFSFTTPIIQQHGKQQIIQQQQQHDDDDDDDDVMRIRFYQWNFAATLTWWILVQITIKKNIIKATHGSVATRPSWMPRAVLHRLQSHPARRIVFCLHLLTLLLAAVVVAAFPVTSSSLLLRLVGTVIVALIVSLYHLVESSVTHRHGEYPLLYSVWAMCLCSSCSSTTTFSSDNNCHHYASAACWGIVIHFVLSTGMAKLKIGGIQWMRSPTTMRFYLTVYRNSKSKPSRPFIPLLNHWICQRKWATIFISTATILLECVVIPMTLFLPHHHHHHQYQWRLVVGCVGMIAMHVAIFCIMSKQVGLVFATTLPTYLIGFHCSAPLWTAPWWVAACIGLGPTLLCFLIGGGGGGGRRLLLPEDWPLSPISLFMFSGHQAQILADTLMTRDTRVVLGTSDKTAASIVGLPVVHHGAVAPLPPQSATTTTTTLATAAPDVPAADEAVHDCVLRVIGFTILQGDLITAIPKPGRQQGQEEWNVGAFVKKVQIFLEFKKRLFETQSGRLLTKAFFIKIDSKGNVAKVLLVAGE